MQGSFFKYRQFNLLFFSSIFFMMSFSTPIAELTDYLELFSQKSNIGKVISMFTLGALLSRFFSGRLADKIGRIPIMLVGTVVTAISGVLYIFTTSLLLLLLLRFFHGLSTGWRPVGGSSFLSDIVPPDRRGEALGYLGIAGSSGTAIGPLIGSVLKEEFSFEAMFIVASLFGIISVVLTLCMKESLPNAEPFKLKMLGFKNTSVLAVSAIPALVAVTLETYSFGTVLAVAPDFVDSLGYSYKGGFLLVIVISSIISRFFAGRAADRMNKVRLMQIGICLSIVALVGMGFSDSVNTITLSGVIYGLSIGITRPTIFAWTVDLSTEGKIALALATMLMGLEIGIFLGSFVSGEIFNGVVHNINQTFWLAAGVSFLALIYLQFNLKSGVKLVSERPK